TRFQAVGLAAGDGSRRGTRISRVKDSLPTAAPADLREGERDLLVVGVEEQKERVADYRRAELVLLSGIAREHHPQALHEARAPRLVAHLSAARFQPGDVLFTTAGRLSAEKPPPLEGRV